MSGSNPFRRSKIITSASTTSSTDESVLPSTPSDAITSAGTACASVNAYDGINETQSSSHHKIVRIATPPLQSPPPTDSTSSYFPAVSFTGLGITAHRGSPPPPAPLQSQLQQPRYDEDSSSDESGPDPFDPRSSDGVDLAIQQRRQQSVEDSSGRTPPKEAKPMNNTLDVDAFTRLLLTGSAEAASSASTSNTTTSRRTASNPDIATATIPLDPPILGQTRIYTNNNETGPNGHDATAAIPRASTFSTATTGSNDVQRTPSLRKPKPPPPRSHHGRPIKPDESGKDPSSSPTPSQTGSPSDRRESISSLSVKVSSSNNELPSTADDASSLHRSSSQSKRPPTPPLSRRHSQMRQSANRHSIAEKPNRLSLPPKSLSQLPGPLSPGPKTPPRPPSRRVERPVSGIPAESSSQLKTSLSQSESTPASDQLSVDEPAFQRLTTTTSSPPSRTPSIKQNPAIMTTATTTMLPPPLPPPRRLRASSKSSSITVSIDNKTDVPITAQTEDIHPSSSQAQDILADLSRLQREVDDLRVHYEGRKVSQ